MNLNWTKCKGGVWCDLFKLNVNHPTFSEMQGIYILWIEKDNIRKVLKIGYGVMSEELNNAKNDLAIQAFRYIGTPMTFAPVDEDFANGILTYLHKMVVSQMSRPPKELTHPIKVNLPW